ncbi:uncharacterized protein LOC115622356 [Scaptodrosophila lebanonensis]|uniref:MOG interacting and ectopic P-granules protein 1 n=1 Tax=Drosophila lebanonensis TaxID=7225 RepID=A0A6J2T5C7_DROLE|nr:uncharacterized protein LOC115622356 [Scaptodrosophila lebanonensis]
MTEVDVVLPEGVAEPTNKLASSSPSKEGSASSIEAVAATESESEQTSGELVNKQQESDNDEQLTLESNSNDDSNKGVKDVVSDDASTPVSPPQPANEEIVVAMEVDDNDIEEGDVDGEDSQITSSTENGTGKEQKLNEVDGDEDEEVTTNGDHDEDDDVDKSASTAENTCDSEDPLAAAQADEVVTEDEETSIAPKKSDELLDEEESQESGTAKTLSDSSGPTGTDEKGEQVDRKTNAINGYVGSPKADSADSQKLECPATGNTEKENGQASAAEAKAAATTRGDAGVVNLDDESDEDVEMNEAKPKVTEQPPIIKDFVQPTKTQVVALSGTESSDDAVLIASDSESEMIIDTALPTKKARVPGMAVTSAPTPKPAAPIVEDEDDDDDCVVIEDDTPPSNSPNEVNKRKSAAIDLDELQQQPNKRQRSSTPSGLGQLTIKDARSLMPHEAPTVSSSTLPRDTVYPVTITNAVTGVATNLGPIGPPKLMPMSAANTNVNAPMLNPPTLSFSGLPSMTNNATLLPGLTDDMYVLEAPSFIVPYIYEKPPNDNIRNVIKDIETKYALSPEDLAEADKSDEFDMITEQNKEVKPADQQEGGGKKKKKRGDDESWSEQSDDDDDEDDDDDSESGMRTKVLIKEASDDLTALKGAIKPAAAVAQSGGGAAATPAKPGQENYFESPLGKFFMDIGVGLVQEYVQSDLLRLQKRKMRKSLSRDPKDFEMAINALSGNLQASKTKNAPYKFTMKRCEFCNFKSESALSMANHYETPHMNGVLYKCNFCTFEIRNATEIVYHMEAVHNIKARLIKPLPYHQCPNCGFEDNGKAKLARHQPVCAKKFRPELNLAPPNDWEAPAKIPRIKPRHGLVGTATAYQAMAAQAAAQKAALATIQQQQQAAAAAARNMQAAALAAQNAAKMRQRSPQLPKALPQGNNMVRNPAPVRGAVSTAANIALQNSYQLAAGQLVQQAAKKPVAGQPSISITPLPRQSAATSGAAASSSKMPQAPAGMKPGQSPSGNNKTQFVICEICDGYIKDLEQLRNHMQWMHKVKIHPKMIYNRPPLNCQKCQFRFFTDQGLERHLLGSHGLVTSSMQEAANKGKDAGRCPVCGRMYQWKLLNHVSRDHHMTLKPAHLSYKCTVCTATFGMYKQFETHVYTAHSTVAKKAMDSKKNSAQSAGAGMSSSGMSRNSLGAANDSLLKPLKINDEITIIPQPASKARITNMESHVID